MKPCIYSNASLMHLSTTTKKERLQEYLDVADLREYTYTFTEFIEDES